MKTLIVVFFLTSCIPILANSNIIVKEISLSPKIAMDKLEKILKNKKFSIFKRINHKKNAKQKGLNLQENEVLIFGNPKIGSILMRENPQIGLALPLKISIFKVTKDKSHLIYIDPASYTNSYNIKNSKLLNKMTKTLNKITDML